MNNTSIMYHASQFQKCPSPPGQTPGHLTFLKNFGQMPHHVDSLRGQLPVRPLLSVKFCAHIYYYTILSELYKQWGAPKERQGKRRIAREMTEQ